jgi:hypothetical protein
VVFVLIFLLTVISEGQLVPLYSVAREAVNKAGYNSEITLAQTEVNKERCLAATMEKRKKIESPRQECKWAF